LFAATPCAKWAWRFWRLPIQVRRAHRQACRSGSLAGKTSIKPPPRLGGDQGGFRVGCQPRCGGGTGIETTNGRGRAHRLNDRPMSENVARWRSRTA
jgi:hypothetical protein